MKYLLPLLIILTTLYNSVYCDYDVFFPDISLSIDVNHKARIFNCRYNSREKVYCEVDINYVYMRNEKNCSTRMTVDRYGKNSPTYSCEDNFISSNCMSRYRLRFDLKLKDFTSKCRNAFKSSAHFKQTTLMYGDNYAQYLSECTDQVSKGKLPSVLNNYNNRKYYFRFITKNDCVFYGYFDKIYTTLISDNC